MCDARIFGPQISEKDRMVVLPPVMTGRSVPEYIRGLFQQNLRLRNMIWAALAADRVRIALFPPMHWPIPPEGAAS